MSEDPVALFDRASAFDYEDREAEAAPLYERALQLGLPADLRPQAVAQLGSTLRNLGRHDEAIRLLADELARTEDPAAADWLRAFLALALASAGREREAVEIALVALAPHLTEYQAAITRYARGLSVHC